jgi:hypothetical protein
MDKDRKSGGVSPVEAVRRAIASTVLEGGTVTPETEALLEACARGEIGEDEMPARVLECVKAASSTGRPSCSG